jgi:hypothetical protein
MTKAHEYCVFLTVNWGAWLRACLGVRHISVARCLPSRLVGLCLSLGGGGMVGRRRVISWGLAQDAQAVGKARELVRKALAEWGLESVQDVVELVVSELVTNAVRHARGPIRLCLTCDGVRLLGAVCDGDPHLPAVGCSQVDDEGGRGLALVEAVTHRWGTQITSTGKRVWFSLLL